MARADLVKLSEEELAFLTDCEDLESGIRAIRHHTPGLLVVTQGVRGCTYAWGSHEGQVPGLRVPAVDTTGAGDGFMAGVLAFVAERLRSGKDPSNCEDHEIRSALAFANAVGALTTTRRGAIPALPERQEVAAFLSGNGQTG
jgi:sugar/nucleoside kinase (ribokinase family)